MKTAFQGGSLPNDATALTGAGLLIAKCLQGMAVEMYEDMIPERGHAVIILSREGAVTMMGERAARQDITEVITINMEKGKAWTVTAETIEGKGWAQETLEQGEGAFLLEAVPVHHPGPEFCRTTLEDGTPGPNTIMEMVVAGFMEDNLAGGLVVLACLQHLTSLEDGDREELVNRIPLLASIGAGWT